MVVRDTLGKLRLNRRHTGLTLLGLTASVAVIMLATLFGQGARFTTGGSIANSVTVIPGMSEAQAVRAVTDTTTWDDRTDPANGADHGPWRAIYVIDCHGHHRKLYGDAASVPCL